jgi:putative transposase
LTALRAAEDCVEASERFAGRIEQGPVVRRDLDVSTGIKCADSKPAIEAKRKAFSRKWRLKCRAVADSLEEAGDKLFTFARFPKSQWKSIRTSNAIERLHEEFKRRIKTQTVLPSAETAAMLFWALLDSGQITMRKVDGWRSLNERPSDQTIDLAA